MAEKESFDIDGLMVFRSDLTAVDQDGNTVASVTTPDKYVPSLKEPLSGEQIGRYTNTISYWREHSTYVPLKGEVIIYSDGGSITEGGTTVYIPKIKIGDGVTTVGNLPFTDSDTQQGTAGTLDTTNESAQTPLASESLSGTVNLHKVAKTGEYSDLRHAPDVNDATLTIQKNSTTIDTFTANASVDKTINITVPTTASDVGALPSSTKYGASLSLEININTYVITAQLKDQDGNNLGSAQTIDLPLESVVVSGSYNAQTKKVVLTLQNGSAIEFSVADLVAGLQSEITVQNPLSADLIVDGTTNKVFTLTMKTKLDGIEAGAEVNVQADWSQTDNTKDDYIKNKPTIPAAQVQSDWNATSGMAQILNKPNLATVATSGSYNDLSNKPTIPAELDDLSDVAISSPSDQQTLVYNPDTQKFENNEPRKLWKNVDIISELTAGSAKNGYIKNDGTWTSDTNRKHWIIPCSGIKEFTITSNQNSSNYYSFLATYTAGNPPSSTYATGYSGRVDWLFGTHTYKVPKDAQYLYLGTGYNEAGKPAALLFTGIAITEKIDDLDDVAVSSPSSGQVLSYNGTYWANANLPSSSTVTFRHW